MASLLTVLVCTACALPSQQGIAVTRDFWSHLKHEVENVAHQVGHAVEGAVVANLANSATAMLGRKRDVSDEKRDFWSHLKHEVENVAHQVGHAVEGAVVANLANSATAMLGRKRDVSDEKRDFWSHLKHEVENVAHQVGHAVEGAVVANLANSATAMLGRKRDVSDEKRDFWSHLKHEVENVAHQVGHAVEGAVVANLANSATAILLGKRDVNDDTPGFWSNEKLEFENVGPQIGQMFEGSVFNSNTRTVGFEKRDIAETMKTFWVCLKDDFINLVHRVEDVLENGLVQLKDEVGGVDGKRDVANIADTMAELAAFRKDFVAWLDKMLYSDQYTNTVNIGTQTNTQ
ncbi:uncharacterized protein [Haliotis asinina]|uniref:uncharacterized protein n=1 Tax=Haliotis asinina TaxID=109174 RepID=UPI003531BBA5